MENFPAGDVPAAKGLKRLTWAQVEVLDEWLDLLCQLTEAEPGECELAVVVRNGKPRRVRRPLITAELKPVR